MSDKENNNGDIAMREMHCGIDLDSNVFEVERDGKVTTVLGLGFENPLWMIEEFVEKISISEKPAFTTTKNKFGKTVLKELPLANYFQLFTAFLNQSSKDRCYSEHVALFFDAVKALHLPNEMMLKNPCYFHPEFGKNSAELFNDIVQWIRNELRTKRFKKKLYVREYNCVRNFDSATEYIAALFERYSRLLVLRIDFGYRRTSEGHLEQVTVEEAQEHLFKFLNNRRGNKLFSAMKGYIWKLESGAEKGPHFHMILFYDGSKSHKDEWLASEIGAYWQTSITGGTGVFHNCNANKNKYKTLGIGMITHSDIEMRNNLLIAVKYLFKKEQYLREKFNIKTRVFGRGEMPRKRANAAGRPRNGTGGLEAPQVPM